MSTPVLHKISNGGRAWARSRRTRSAGLFSAVAVTALALTGGPGSTAMASMPSTGLERLGIPVADQELAGMRGRYIRPDGVAYFGIQLQSSWESESGSTAATMLISVNFNGESGNLDNATSRVLVGWSGDCNGCSDASVEVGGGLDSVSGVVQSQEIAGSDNQVRNDMRINITGAETAPSYNESGLTEITDSTSVAGGAVRFAVTNNEIGLTILGRDSEMVRQSISSELGQMAQNVRLASNFNTIQNNFAVTVGLDQLRQSEVMNVQNALSVMAGNGF